MRISDWSSDVCSSDLLEAALAAAHADISARDILIDTLRVQIARLKRMQFGKSSEKLDTQIAQLELALEELEGEAIVAAARRADPAEVDRPSPRSEEHTSELQSLMRISYAVFCLKKKKRNEEKQSKPYEGNTQ